MKTTSFTYSLIMSSLIAYSANSMGDDIDIYMKGKLTKQTLSNTLLMVDSSGSMNEYLPNGRKKIEAAKESLVNLINSLNNNKKVGLGTYNGNKGGSILYPIRSLHKRVYPTSISTIYSGKDDFIEGVGNDNQENDLYYLGFGINGKVTEEVVKEYDLHGSAYKKKRATQCIDGNDYKMNPKEILLGVNNECDDGHESGLLFKDIDIGYKSELLESYIQLVRSDKDYDSKNLKVSVSTYKNIGNIDGTFTSSSGEDGSHVTMVDNPEYVPPEMYEGEVITPAIGTKKIEKVHYTYKAVVDMDKQVTTYSDDRDNTSEINEMHDNDHEFDIFSKVIPGKGGLQSISRIVKIGDLSPILKPHFEWAFKNRKNGKTRLDARIKTIVDPILRPDDFMKFHSGRNSDSEESPKLVLRYMPYDKNVGAQKTQVGLNFRHVNIASYSDVESAKLTITAYAKEDILSPILLNIKIMDYNNGDSVFDGKKISSMGEPLASKSVTLDNWINRNSYEIDVQEMVESAIARDGFCGGDNMLFVIEHIGVEKEIGILAKESRYYNLKTSLDIKQGKVNSNSCAKVTTYVGEKYQDISKLTSKRYGESSLMTVKEKLIASAMDDVIPGGKTPTLGSTVEAFKYFTGDLVSNVGKKRSGATKRMSHEDSFIGGERNVTRIGCGDASYNNVGCVIQETTGDPRYISPISDLECETNNIVMITDGVPNEKDDFFEEVNTKISGSCSSLWGCIIDFTSYMSSNDLMGALDNEQKITTDVIGFDVDTTEEESNKLVEYASAGNGEYLSVDNAMDLTSLMYEVVNKALDVTTIALPGVSVDQSNKLQLKDELYFSLFVPTERVAWGGNVKKYFIKNGKIVDADDVPAIDLETGMFVEETRSAWSSLQDGGNSLLGGAGSKGTINRNIFTYIGELPTSPVKLIGDKYRFDINNPSMSSISNVQHEDHSHENVSDFMAEIRDYLKNNDNDVSSYMGKIRQNEHNMYYGDMVNSDKFLSWMNGKDVFDEDADDNTEEPRRYISDPLHAKPIIINYDGDDETVFIPTNDGTLHGINGKSGEELFAFVPQQLIKNLYKKAFVNFNGKHQYGLDSTWVAYRHDKNRNGTIGDDSGDFVNIYGGMRRGGSSIYSLDVTKIRASEIPSERIPTFNWEINPTVAGFEGLGQTWSTPVIAQILLNNIKRTVLVFGGGYDKSNDFYNFDVSQKGSQIYMVDAISGDLVWKASSNSSDDLTIPDMKYSIPNKLEILDMDNDGLIDYIYANDVAGQIFKIKIKKDNEGASDLAIARLFAKIGKTVSHTPSNDRKFYEKLTVVPVIDRLGKALYIATGTGYRARPFNKQNKDALFVIKDREINPESFNTSREAVEMSDLMDVTLRDNRAEISADMDNTRGYYIWFNATLDPSDTDFVGEKMIGNITASNNRLLFTTYVPNKEITESMHVPPTNRYLLTATIFRYAYTYAEKVLADKKVEPTCFTYKTEWGDGKYCYPKYITAYRMLMRGETNVTYDELYAYQYELVESRPFYKQFFDRHQDYLKAYSKYWGGVNKFIMKYDTTTQSNAVFNRADATYADASDDPKMEKLEGNQSSTDGVMLENSNGYSAEICDDTGLGKTRRYVIDIYTGVPEKLNQDEPDPTGTIIENRYKVDKVSGFSAGTKILYTSDGVVAITNTTVEVVDDSKGLGVFNDRWLRLHKDESLVPPHIDSKRKE
jgi:hypothetical protein